MTVTENPICYQLTPADVDVLASALVFTSWADVAGFVLMAFGVFAVSDFSVSLIRLVRRRLARRRRERVA